MFTSAIFLVASSVVYYHLSRLHNDHIVATTISVADTPTTVQKIIFCFISFFIIIQDIF